MNSIESIIFLAITVVAYLAVAAWASRGVSSKDSYLLGDRQFGVGSITLTLIATQVGAGMIFGTAAESYNKGFLGIAYVLGMVLGLIILGLGVGARLRSLNISTAAELFETKYDSPGLRKIAAVISILTMGGILAAQIVASRQLFATLFTISPIWLALFWLTIIAYTTFGGLKAIIATDILQVIMIVVVFTAVLFYIIPLGEFTPTLSSGPGSQGPVFSDGFFAALIAPVLFSMIEQDLAQRCFAAKTKRVATISSLLAALFLLAFALVPVSLGMYAKANGIVFSPGESPLVLLFQAKLPAFGLTIVACALLAAICSTADSLLGAASTNLIADFLPTDGKFSLSVARMLTMLLGIVALIVAFNFDDVIKIIIKSYEISIAALFVPMILAMYVKKPSRRGAKLSIGFGITSFMALNAVGAPSATMIALLISAVGFLLGYLLDRKTMVQAR
jgi:solute:Na+ symporter, SSS family